MKKALFILLVLPFFAWSQTSFYLASRQQSQNTPIASNVTVTIDDVTDTSFRVTVESNPCLKDVYIQVNGTQTNTEVNCILLHRQSPGVNGNGGTLLPNTSYTFTVIGTFEDGSPYTSDPITVTTLAAPPPPDPVASITATDPTATEDGLTIGFATVSLDTPSNGTSTINYTVSGSATSGVDYVSLTGSVDISDGAQSATINVTPLQDVLEEGSEVVTITLASGVGYTIDSSNVANISIVDDDGDPSSPDWFGRNIATPSYVYTNPTGTEPLINCTYTPTSAAQMSDGTRSGCTAILSNTFSLANATIDPGQRLVPDGGAITGTNINLNGAYIVPNTSRAFATSARFSNVYNESRIYPELFGAVSNNSNDDILAIEAMIINCEFAITVNGGIYTINRDRHSGQFNNTVRRFGNFDWDLNGATIVTTNNSTFRQAAGVFTHQGYYLLTFRDFDLVSIYNGEMDGNNLASRFIDVYDVDNFNFDNLQIRNLMSPVNAIARAQAFNFAIFPQNGFTRGFITNSTFDDINAPGDGIPNNSSGISKALNFSNRGNEISDVFIDNNDFNNIIGDDAEAFYCRPDGDYESDLAELYFHIKNNNFFNCNRRAIKFDASNGFIENNLMVNSQTDSDITQAAMVQIFSIQQGRPVKNVLMRNNTIRILGYESQNSFLGINDSRDIIVINNTFFADFLTVSRSISFSITDTQQGLYSGDLSNVEFTNNTITNGIISIEMLYNILPGLNEIVFENNSQIITNARKPDNKSSLGAFRAAINIGGSSLSGVLLGNDEFRIKNHQITYSAQSTGTWNGVISSNGMEPKNVVLDNVDITYTNNSSVGAIFGGVRNESVVNYDSTNQILNCNIIGRTGTGALEFNGTNLSVLINDNSTGDNNSPITFN